MKIVIVSDVNLLDYKKIQKLISSFMIANLQYFFNFFIDYKRRTLGYDMA